MEMTSSFYDVSDLVLILVYIIGSIVRGRLLCRSVYLTLAPLSTCRMRLGISTKYLAVSQLPSFLYIMCARTSFIMQWLRLFVVFQEIQCLHYDVGRQDVDVYPCIKFCLSQCFPLSVTCTYICCIGQDCFFVVYQEIVFA